MTRGPTLRGEPRLRNNLFANFMRRLQQALARAAQAGLGSTRCAPFTFRTVFLNCFVPLVKVYSLAMAPLVLPLFALAVWLSPPEPLRPTAIQVYQCQTLMGYSTASARSRFEELQGHCSFSRAVPAVETTALSQLLARASARRHWQQKIGKNLTFCVFSVGEAPHQVIVSAGGYVLDLTAKREYRVVRPEDVLRYAQVYQAIVGK